MEKLKEKLNEKFKDEYIHLLAISDHLKECIKHYENYKYCKNKDKEILNRNKKIFKDYLYEELMDLLILLELIKKDNCELYEQRLNKFISKINKDTNNLSGVGTYALEENTFRSYFSNTGLGGNALKEVVEKNTQHVIANGTNRLKEVIEKNAQNSEFDLFMVTIRNYCGIDNEKLLCLKNKILKLSTQTLKSRIDICDDVLTRLMQGEELSQIEKQLESQIEYDGDGDE